MIEELSRPPPLPRPSASLAPVAWVLFAATASLVLAALTLYPRGPRPADGAGVVHAADSTVARRSPAVIATGSNGPEMQRTVAPLPVRQELAVEAPLTLACRVLDREGHGVAGAQVWADDGDYALRGTTDDGGLFVLELDAATVRAGWRDGTPVQVGARHDKYAPSLLAAWSEARGGELELELRGPAAELLIQVVDSARLPIAGVELHVIQDLGHSRAPLAHDGTPGRVTPGPPGWSNLHGEVLLRGLEPGAMRVELAAPGYCPTSYRVELMTGERLETQLHMFGASSVNGYLTRADGRVLTCARVSAVGEDPSYIVRARVDADGRYFLRNVPAGKVVLHAECREHGKITHSASSEIVLRAGERGSWDAQLYPVDTLGGRLVDSRGRPLVGWRIELQFEGAEQGPLHVTNTDEDGRYELPDSRARRGAQLFVYAPGSAGGLPTRVLEVDRAADSRDELRLDPGEEHSSTLRGFVRDSDGRPAVGVSFQLWRAGTNQSVPLTTNLENGSFETPALPPGNYFLLFPHHGRGWIPDVLYRLAGTQGLDIGSVSLPSLGSLALSPGAPSRQNDCREIRLILYRPQIAPDFAYTVHEGRVDLPIVFDLAPGEYALQTIDVPDSERLLFLVESARTYQLLIPNE